MKTKFTLKYAFVTALVALAGSLLATAGVFLTGHDLVWHGDELFQNVNKLMYFGTTFRSAIASFVSGNGFDFPAYTLDVGYGMDTVTLLGSLGNVFDWPSVFFPPACAEYYYVAMIFIRIVFAALAFSFYCLQRGVERDAAFVGSICYALAGYMVFLGALRHPGFLTAAVFLPLVFAGIDRVFEGGNPWIFIFSMAAQLLASVYFAYMLCLAMLAYCLIKYFAVPRERSVRDFAVLVGKFVLFLLVAFGISAIIACPRVLALSSQGRLSLERFRPLFYDATYYLDMLPDAIGISGRTKTLYFGAVGIAAMAIFIMCRKRYEKRDYIPWFIGAVVVLLCMCLPSLSSVLNGFSYATDRWMFAACFCWSYIVCLTVPVIRSLERLDKLKAAVFCSVFVVLCVTRALLGDMLSTRIIVMALVFVAVVAFILFVAPRLSARANAAVLSVATIAGVAVASAFYCIPFLGGSHAEGFVEMGEAESIIFSKSYAAVIDEIPDDSLFRYASTKNYGMRNISLNHGNSAVDFYNANYNQRVDDFRTELGMSDNFFNTRFFGTNSRLAVDALTGTRYYVSKKADNWLVPFSYEKTDYTSGRFRAWQTDVAVPLAFATPFAISQEEYDELGMAEKQEILLHGCVVKDDVAEDYERASTELTSKEFDYSVTVDKNVVYDEANRSFTVLKNGATAKLSFEGAEKSETYLQLSNLDYQFLYPSDFSKTKGSKSKRVVLQDLLSTYPSTYGLNVAVGEDSFDYEFATNHHPRYGGKHNWILNTGYHADSVREITVKFSRTGVYMFDDMSVVCQPVEPIVDAAKTLASGGAEQISFNGNVLEATIEADSPRSLAVFTVPYSRGWSAMVDGKPADIEHADTAFMAVGLEREGSHEVELHYTAPGMRLGAALTGLSLAALVAIGVISHRTRLRTDAKGVSRG